MRGKSGFHKYVIMPFCVLVALCVLFTACFRFIIPGDVMKVFGFRCYLVSYTGSMEPMLNYNDLIVVKKYNFDDLQKGDVITFLARSTSGEQITVTHMVNDIYVDEESNIKYIQTKGINLEHPDSVPVTANGINDTNTYIGKYTGKSVFLGNLIAFSRSAQGITAILVCLSCSVLIYITISKSRKHQF